MSKTNHRTNGKSDIKFPSPLRDYCNGKRGERRDVAGAKKYVHSRHRSNTKTTLAALSKSEEGTDYSEVMRESVYESNYRKIHPKAKHKELVPWQRDQKDVFLLGLKGRGYHDVPGRNNVISDTITNCSGCSICKAQ